MDDRPDRNDVRVLIESEQGRIEVEIDAARAPGTAENFLRYVDGGYYDGGQFHRTVTMENQPDNDVRIEVIQAGINPSRVEERFAPIPLERTNHHRPRPPRWGDLDGALHAR